MAMRDWITKDLGWKLFSLFLAVAIWLIVHKIYEEPRAAFGSAIANTVTFGNLPVHVVSSVSDVRNFQVAPTTVKVTVSGSAEVMNKLQAEQVHAVVNLTDIGPERDLHVPVEISAPPGVALVNVDPPQVGVVIPPPNDKKP
jgi:YbbR domain-containing protein